ncbi:hypothetical protein DTO013E5_3222 [Penicillium roqueforti]|uniref:uncharacterized protein n=1 Tax=Penicillium roqueforti TaxID=5082 RepID=UPI00190A1ECF|nr:uncharacterized protein LCP9604111_6011 [Penicillium roqueforti]KAF9247821.1 hypothetical protein LCP9604111_6011 [Penicillium roqueforti]KAI1836985.1 hypothetical protein CBS147337_2237 [Penicillium roqueforti]KAI2678043.1 hypothetical protein CBS147355_5044 [Penicillium roqueforti]KAI2686608.1 hypothetical protein LCP963914a_4208 [Penicillium roqueforti]KAI2704405.1 hypothetical protein CBS147372_2874 [Penicillium roqueforti]
MHIYLHEKKPGGICEVNGYVRIVLNEAVAVADNANAANHVCYQFVVNIGKGTDSDDHSSVFCSASMVGGRPVCHKEKGVVPRSSRR